ncbi:uncharacterized protein LOC144582210 [Callithrix jacchus]
MVEDETGLCGFSGFAHPAAPCQEKEELSAACWRLEPVAPRLASLQWVAATETAEHRRDLCPFVRRAKNDQVLDGVLLVTQAGVQWPDLGSPQPEGGGLTMWWEPQCVSSVPLTFRTIQELEENLSS